nr:MAG TPA: MAEBL protein [Caudoviricetes sp.]
MIKNNVYYEWFASITVPNPDQVGYWIDLGADSKGRIIKVYNRDIEKWIVLFDVSKDDYVPPFIGPNGNWWVDNRDTGVKATAETPYIGENDHWFTYDPINKVYVDTGIEARGLSAYDIAVKLGFKGSEQDWIDSLSKASEDAAVAALEAANKANEAADKANQAVEEIEGIVDDAIAATDKAEEIASNPPKIVDGDWWIYDYDTKQYVNTGIAAIGDAFTYKKEYPSVEAMEADWGTADVKLGEYVLINTNDVEDPDDAKVYLKTQEGWKFIVDLSGMQGIQGWSAYEVAVKHGFVGTEAEWVQSLKQPALDAAAEALEAKAQVEATEKAVKEAEALRVTAEQGRVNAENTRVSNENTRISNEDNRKAEESKRVTAENARIAAETSRKEAESSRVNAESDRVEAEGARAAAEQLRANSESERNTKEKERIANEAIRVASESERVTAETSRKEEEAKRVEAETARNTAEQERESNEATRQANEAIRETQEAAREKNTSDAITAVNEAKTAAQQATTNATTAANNANTQANRAKEYADNPPKVGDDGYWYLWDEVDDVYVNTGWPSSGIILKGRLNSPEELGDIVDPQLSDSYIVGTDLYFWNGTKWVNMGRFQGPQGEPGKDAELSKAAIEAVLVGEVTTHTHDTRYYTKDQTDANIKVVADDLANNYYNKSQVDSKFTSVYIFKGSVDTIEDLPTEGNVIGDVWNVRKSDTNYAWTSEGWDALGGTAELSSLTANGLMSKEDFAKLQGIEAGAQVNKIETITKRVLLNVVDKNVTIPEDIAISPDEPTNNEIIWMDTDEDYDFTFDGYSKVDADARFVHQVEGKDLSTNDYSNADKNKVDNLNSYVTSGSFTQDANNAAITLNIKDPVTDNNSNQVLTINKATTTTAGVMSAADKTKLEGLSNYDDTTIKSDIANLKSNKLETIEVTGTGNVITTVTKDGTKIAFAKGITAMTQDTSDARYVKKTGDTMSGKLNISVSIFNTELSTDGVKLENSKTESNAKGLFWRDFNREGYIGGIGMYTSGNGTQYTTARSYIGWGNSPWSSASSVSISDSTFTYKDNNIWHAGNDGSGSGLDADLLDGCQLVTVGDATGPHSVVYRPTIGNYRRFWHIGNLPTVAATSTGESKVVFHVCGLVNFGTTEEIYATITASTRGSIAVRVINHIGNAAQYQVGYVATDSEVQIWIANSENYGGTSSLDICVSKGFTLVNSTQTTEPENIVYANINRVVTTSNLEDTLAYWYENDENNSSTTCATGGNRNVIESLKSKFKRCIAKPYGDDAALISYLNETDSNKWPDGTGATYETVRKESLMVHFPKYYHKTIERSPGIWRTYISEQQIDNDYIEEPELLLGTFEGIISDENGGALTSTGSSISAASKTIAQFVAAAKVNGSMYGIGDYRSHATIARMFCAYYKTTNISTSNSAIPCSGGTKRYNYGWTGGTKALGNRDGKAAVKNDAGYYSTNFLGLEDCYYSKWEFVQGINILKGKYVVYDGGSFPDKDVAELEAAGATNIRVVGYEPNPAATEAYNGWTKAVAQGKYGDVVPTAHGGSETTYYSDYSWFNPTGNGIFLRSGASAHGSPCGVFMAAASYASSASWTTIGARLAFYGKIVVVDSDTFKKMQA